MVFISERWFSDNERTISTAIGTFSNLLGINLGYMFPTLYVGDNTVHNEFLKYLGKNLKLFILFCYNEHICRYFMFSNFLK